MIPDTDKAYIAGLFDGEGSIYFANDRRRKRNTKVKGYRISISQRISMEITMTDESVLVGFMNIRLWYSCKETKKRFT